MGLLVLLVIASAATASALFFDNVHRAKIAERMMDDASRLRVNESSLADVRAFASRYQGTTTGKWHSDPCVETDCLAVTEVPEEEFWQKHPKLSDWRVKLYRRRWTYSVLMWVEHGKLADQEQWFIYVTPKNSVAVITHTSEPSEKLCQNQSYRLHRAFAANFSPHHFNVWVDAKASAERDLLTLQFTCATTYAGCTAVSEVVPIAWQHYEADQQLLAASDGESSKLSNCR